MTAPETQARNSLIALLTAEFGPTAENVSIRSDRLHASVGNNQAAIGVSPETSLASTANNLVLEMRLLVQFYNKYDLKVDPDQAVDPAVIEAFAERFRERVRTSADPNTDSVWYFTLDTIEYPKDPTGNITRFEAHLTARGNNTALVETTA